MSNSHIAGYAGYKPGAKFKSIEPRAPEIPTANIPGYSGYVFAYGPENIYGKTFSAISKEIKCTNKYRDRDNFEEKVISITKESYLDPKTQDNDQNKIPSRNKFIKRTNFDVEKTNFMAVECRERMLKQLGSGTARLITEMLTRKIKEKKEREEKKPLKLYPPIVGYGAANRQVAVSNLHAKDWQSCRKEAKKLIENNINTVKVQNHDKFGANIFSEKSIKKDAYNSYQPISGYTGFVNRMQADNIFGCTYLHALEKSKGSNNKLSYWKKFEDENVSKSLPSIGKGKRQYKEAWK